MIPDDVSLSELVGHVLREEPVGDSSTVHNLRPNHFVHQHCDHLQRHITSLRFESSLVDPQTSPVCVCLYLWVVPPHVINHFEYVQLPFVTLSERLQDLMKPGGMTIR